MSDKDFVVKNGLVVNNFLTVNATTVYVGNSISNATVNTTIYTGTSNNVLYVGTVADNIETLGEDGISHEVVPGTIATRTSANMVSNAQLSANLLNYERKDQLADDVAHLHANSALHLGPRSLAAAYPTGTTYQLDPANYVYTNYAKYNDKGTFSNNITINGNVVFANVNQEDSTPNRMIVVGNTTFQNNITISGSSSYISSQSNVITLGTALYVIASGNVGISNNTPAHKLAVGGSTYISSNLTVVDQVTFSNTLAVTNSAVFSNSVSVANLTAVTNSAVFGTAAIIYSNGNIGVSNTAPVDKISVTGNVAVSDTIKVGTATINATNYSQTANNSINLRGEPGSNFVNTNQLATTLSTYHKVDAVKTIEANTFYTANLEMRSSTLVINTNATIWANGSVGAAGQALLSNSTGVYWGSVNTSVIIAPSDPADNPVTNGNTYVLFNDNATMATRSAFSFNKDSNTLTIGVGGTKTTINATSFSGTANNALNLNGSAATDYAKKVDTTYIGTTSIALNRTSASQTLYGVSIDGIANNAINLNGVAGSSYQLNSLLAANVATMTAGNTAYVGTIAAADVASKTYVGGQLSNYLSLTAASATYAALSGATFSGTVSTTNNLTIGTIGYFNGTGLGVGRSPSFKLDVEGTGRFLQDSVPTSGAIRIREGADPNWSGTIQFVDYGNSQQRGYISVDKNQLMTFGNGGNSLMRINGNGVAVSNQGIASSGNGRLESYVNAPQNAIWSQLQASAHDCTGIISYVQNGAYNFDFFGAWKENVGRVWAIDGGYNSRLKGSYYSGGAFRMQDVSAGLIQFYDNPDPDGGIWNYTINMDSTTFSFAMSTSSSPYDIGEVKAYIDSGGSFVARGNVIAYWSDRRLKNIISTIPNALDKVKSLNGIIYKNNDIAKSFGYTGEEEQVGVIAQEIIEVLPEVVGERENGILAVRYEKIVPLLIEAIKELKAEIDQLKGK